MANNISEKLAETWKKLPNAINGNGQNFIFLLKTLLGDLKEELDDKFEEISNIANSVTDAPEEIDEQLQNCKIQEVRVGTNISLILTWDYSNVKNYDSAEIYIKETKGNIADHKNWDEVEVSRTIRTTKADTVTVDGINAGYIYQITFQAKNTFGSVSRKSGCPVLQYEVSSMNNSPDPPLEFNVYFNKSGVLWTWKQPANLDSSYSELRTNTDVGNKVGLLEVTQDTKSTVMPSTREGTAYLYNKGYGSKYSTPLSKPWSKPIPKAPQALTVNTEFQGLLISYSPIPEDCIGICISINGEKHFTSDDSFHYYCVMGDFTVKAAYYDCFGEGTWTKEQTVSIVTLVDPAWLKRESITLEKVDKSIQTAVKDAQDSVAGIAELKTTTDSISSTVSANKTAQDAQNKKFVSQISQTSSQVSSVVTDLSKAKTDLTNTKKKVDSNYTAILQNQNDIALRVKTGELIQQINLSEEGVAINGSKVHITGETVFDDGVIVSSYLGDKQIIGTKIADGAITTRKLSANSVTAGKLATNSVTTDKIAAGAINADKIDTGAVTADKIETGAITADKLTSGAVTADKLAANEIDMAGALKIVGGNVTLDENGLSVDMQDEGKINFGSGGVTVSDSSGNMYSAIRRVCMGVAKNGNYIAFDPPWEVEPCVLVFPQTIVTADTSRGNTIQRLHCYADEISKNGFRIHVYEAIDTNSYTTPVNKVILDKKEMLLPQNKDLGPWEGEFSFNIPSKPKEINLVMTVSAELKGGIVRKENGEVATLPGGVYVVINKTGYDRGTCYLTVYADNTVIYSGSNFITNFLAKYNSSTRITYQTGPLKLNDQNNIHGTLRVDPAVFQHGLSPQDFHFSVSIDYAQGYLDTGDVTSFIDSDCNAVFFATDKVSSGYRVS